MAASKVAVFLDYQNVHLMAHGLFMPHGTPVQDALATMAVTPLTAAERAQVERAKASDFTGLYTRDEQRNWIQL